MAISNLSKKETLLLKDLKKHEEICIIKYNNYVNQAQDPQLKQIFQSHAQQEQEHFDTINQILNGQVPNMQNQNPQQNQGQQQNVEVQQQNQNQQSNQNSNNLAGNLKNVSDEILCNDVLMTEKYVSSTYDTAIYEFTNTNIRQVLNHIQKEEQQHGEDIFNYMNSHGMYMEE